MKIFLRLGSPRHEGLYQGVAASGRLRTPGLENRNQQNVHIYKENRLDWLTIGSGQSNNGCLHARGSGNLIATHPPQLDAYAVPNGCEKKKTPQRTTGIWCTLENQRRWSLVFTKDRSSSNRHICSGRGEGRQRKLLIPQISDFCMA